MPGGKQLKQDNNNHKTLNKTFTVSVLLEAQSICFISMYKSQLFSTFYQLT